MMGQTNFVFPVKCSHSRDPEKVTSCPWPSLLICNRGEPEIDPFFSNRVVGVFSGKHKIIKEWG